MLTPAYAGTVNLSPPLGPPETTIIIGYSGSLPATQYTCNIDGGADMGWIPQTSTFSYMVPAGTPIGTIIYVNCRQEWVDEPDASTAIFTVTAGDSDGDGMPDDIDQCPFEFGQTQNGCPFVPDSDGDGVGDPTDQCLYVFGTLPNGCPPDSDGDGIGDPTDQCPFEAAQTENGCPAQPTNTPQIVTTDQPVITPPAINPSFIDPNITPALDAILAGCADLRPQADRLSIGALMRLLGTSDPCGALTNALRDLSFGTLRDGEVKLIMDALGGDMRGTCGISPEVPSTEYLRMLRNAYRVFPVMSGELNTTVMALASAAVGTPERDIFCAFMAMDGAGMNRLLPSPLTDNHRFLIAAAECLPSYPEDSDLFVMRSAVANFGTYGYNAGMFLSAVNNPASHPLMCQIFRQWGEVFAGITAEEEQLATHLIRDCRVNWLNLFVIDGTDPLSFGSAATAIQLMRTNGTPDEITALISDLTCDSIYRNLLIWKRRFESAVSGLIGRNGNENGNGNSGGFGNPQIPDLPDLGLGGNRFRVPSLIDLIGGTTLPRIYPATTLAGYVFEDVCDESAVDLDFREPLPSGCVEIAPRIVSSDNFWDESEVPIGAVVIKLFRYTEGSPNCSGDDYLYITSTGADGYYEFPNLEAGNYELSIDADEADNIEILGTGEWSYRRGEGARKLCLGYTLRGVMPPVMALGFNRIDGIGNTGLGNFVIPPVFIPIQSIDDGGEVSWRPPPIPPLEPNVPTDSEVSSDWRPPPIPPLTDFGIDNPSDVVSWKPPPIPLYEALVLGLAYAPPPNVDLKTAVDALSGALRWEDFSFEMDSRGLFIGIGNPEEPARLFMAQNGGISEFDLPNTPLSIGMTPDGKLAGIIGENVDGSRVVSILNVENGFWIPLFTSTPDIIPTGDNPFFVAEYLYFSATDPNGAPGIYKVNPIAPSTPELVLNDATQGNMTPDGVLLTFVRGGNVFVQNTNTAFIAQITDDGSCGSPVFDAVGFSLYFVCGGKLFVYGLDGVKPIVDDIVVQSVSLGPVDGTLIFSDGQSAYLSDLNGANRRPFMRLSNLSVITIRWQPPLPMPAPQS
jgi:hypothetical protein